MDKIKQLLKDFKNEPLGIVFLDKRFEEMKNPAGYTAPYYRFFYHLTKALKPKVVVELGSWQGTSAAYLAAGCPEAQVITVDHHSDPGDVINRNMTEEAEAKFANLTYFQGWTCEEIYREEKDRHVYPGKNAFPRVINALDGKKIDILFIDSWHVYHQAKRDWNAYKPYLADDALVIVDDVLKGTAGSAIDRIDKFWQELTNKDSKDNLLEGSLHAGYPMGFLRLKK